MGAYSAQSDGARVMKSTKTSSFQVQQFSFSFISEEEQNVQQGFVAAFQFVDYFCIATLDVTEHVHSCLFFLCD